MEMGDMEVRNLENVRENLARFESCRDLFESFLRLFAERGDLAVAVSGSLASGEMDEYSDLDLELIVPEEQQVGQTIEWLIEAAHSLGGALASFPATHLGLRDLRIFFFERDGAVAKADVWVMSAKSFDAMPRAKLVIDPGGRLRARRSVLSNNKAWQEPDFSDLHNKFAGWIWYTCIKIARGEYTEAADSLGTMRSFALLPCLQYVHGLPYEGYRKLETRFPAGAVAALQATYPAQMSLAELVRALSALTEMFEEVQLRVAQKLGRDHRTARLARMRSLFAHWAAKNTADRSAK